MKPQWDCCCVDSINFRFDLCDLLEARVVIVVIKQCQGVGAETPVLGAGQAGCNPC